VVATAPSSPAAEAFRAIAARAVAALEESKGQAKPAPRIVVES
jgi:hypothetical protein